MDLHFKNCHTPEEASVARLPFVLLPPGTWQVADVVAHYRNLAPGGVAYPKPREMDFNRIARIERLRPLRCYIGKDSWLGYHLFEFAHSKRVVLECPIKGNATYVLRGNWKAMVSHTKAELRENFPHHYIKVVHKGDWLHRVRLALRG